jgi:cytochrome c oxidase cbb3-type subunit 2
VYLSLGCVSCHTQQVRPAGQGSDLARGLGVRPSVARDYVLQPQVLLGDRRIGPDLANYGARKTQIEPEALLTDPASSGAVWHPSYRFVDAGSRTALIAYLKSLRQDYPSPEAKLKK